MRACEKRFLIAGLGWGLLLPVMACGYHDARQIRIGALNWIYEDSLHVNGAIDDAQKAGVLPADKELERITARGPYREQLDAEAFEKTVRALRQLGAALQSCEGEGFSLVLVETALWSTFPASGSGQTMAIDAGGSREGDLVLVTGAPVVFALVQGDLNLSDAHEAGFIKLYGTPDQISRFFQTYGSVEPQEFQQSAR